ncbi:MAG: glycine cleavage system aminomethyltransferase GcvT [Bdellovibrionales bacterium]
MLHTPLYDLHVSLGAKMVAFAGYAMPVQYPAGVLKEHLHTRAAAGLFDISHMGQVSIEGRRDAMSRLETLMPGEFLELAPGQIRYSFLLNEQGGVMDDVMVTRPAALERAETCVDLIVNAACKQEDFAHMQARLGGLKVTMRDDRALLALQGPLAAKVLARFCEAPHKLAFMQSALFDVAEAGPCLISRSGYTGEDGFEISVASDRAEKFCRALLAHSEVLPVGLGARDTLRLEAGLCLYGHDLDTMTTPVEAGLVWAIGKRRRTQGGFPGAAVVQSQLQQGAARKRVGIRPEGRALAREQTEILDAEGMKVIGIVTSGGFGPSVNGPVAMGYVATDYAKPGTRLMLRVRGNLLSASTVSMPFVAHRYATTPGVAQS